MGKSIGQCWGVWGCGKLWGVEGDRGGGLVVCVVCCA